MMHAPSTRANLDKALEIAQPHLRPIIEAVRDLRCGLLVVAQGNTPFRLPRDPGRPAIILIGDDMHRSIGPDGYHMPSVRRAIRASQAFAVISCEALPHVYASMAATAAVTRRNVLIVETQPAHEIQWANLIRKLAPGKPLWLAVVEGGHA